MLKSHVQHDMFIMLPGFVLFIGLRSINDIFLPHSDVRYANYFNASLEILIDLFRYMRCYMAVSVNKLVVKLGQF